MRKETAEALEELRFAVCKMQGWDPAKTEMSVCRNTEPSACDTKCLNCEGQTHHWLENVTDLDNTPYFECKHCDHFVLDKEMEIHPSGCDCPHCLPDGIDFYCEDGHDWVSDFNGGRVCEVCGIRAKGVC